MRRIHQHRLYFKTGRDARRAASALEGLNTVIMNARVRACCKSLSFQTAYALGPITRRALCHQLQPVSSLFNRDGQSFEKVPVWRQVSASQVLLVLTLFVLCCGPSLLMGFYQDLWTSLCFMVPVAWISNDILGLVSYCVNGKASEATK